MAAAAALLALCVGALPPCPAVAGPACVSTVAKGSGGGARTLVVSPDDTLVAWVATWHQTGVHNLNVHNIITGAAVPMPNLTVPSSWTGSQDNALRGAAFSPDSTSLAVVGFHGVSAISVATGKQLWSAQRGWPDDFVTAVAFSPDEKHVACAVTDGAIYILEASTGRDVSVFSGVGVEVFALHYTPDISGIITAVGGSKDVVVMDATTGDSLHVLPHSDKVQAVAVSPDGRYLAAATATKSIVVYSLSDYSTVHTIAAKTNVSQMSFTHDGAFLAASGQTTVVHIYSVASGSWHSSFSERPATVGAPAFLHKSDRFLAALPGSNTSRILLWDPELASHATTG
eukprot:TRINITY_DN3905_c0_g1_i3.p1 TRINITY_DN3905_c0_g1~~TRINITY_DN3905_c0_g1_i3.p1  ORF type:complete len:343 (+),score=77.87 TRINITY_DN3905_c0_g1_i3:67-1095(+)